MGSDVTPQSPSQQKPARSKKSIRWSLLKKRFNFSKRTSIALISGIVLVSAVTAGVLIQRTAMTKKVVEAEQTNELIENLEYQTVVPKNATISDLGGWRRVSPPGKTPVYAYSDKIGSVAINVSQQPLPDKFVGNAEREVAELAKAYSATTEIDAGGTKAYLGTSAKGPQSVIFTKNNLLIMIKSQDKVPESAWADYIKALG